MSHSFEDYFGPNFVTAESPPSEIALTLPEINLPNVVQIKSDISIYSTVSTVLRCPGIEIDADNVTLKGIVIISSITIEDHRHINIINCILRSNTQALEDGVSISHCTNVTIENTEFCGYPKNGIIVMDTSTSILLKQLTMHDISEAMIKISNKSQVIIQTSVFFNGSGNALLADDESIFQLTCSRIYNIEKAAIQASKCRVQLESNEIHDLQSNALLLTNIRQGNIIGNKVTNISASAICLGEDSFIHCANNIIQNVSKNAFFVTERSEVTLLNNSIENSEMPGIIIMRKCTARIISNKLLNVGRSAICIRAASQATIMRNEISTVKECGISISDTQECLVKMNRILSCDLAGVEAYDNSLSVKVESNVIANIKEYGIMVYSGACITGSLNEISNVPVFVRCRWNGGGSFINNVISNCSEQMEGPTTGDYFFQNNGEFIAITNNLNRAKNGIKYEKKYIDVTEDICLKCHQRPRSCFFKSCGHRVFCRECGDEALEHGEKCPMCRFNIVGITHGFSCYDSDLCAICFERKADSIVIPCGHTGFCHVCLERWYEFNKMCPFCRTETTNFKQQTNTGE